MTAPGFRAEPISSIQQSLVRAIAPHLASLRGGTFQRRFESDVTEANAREWDALQDMWTAQAKRVLDIGAGYGRSTVMARAAWPDAELVAYDGDGTGSAYKEQCERGADTYYGNLAALREFLDANGCDARIVDARKTPLRELGTFDIILSMYAVGYHWRLEDFADDLAALSNPDTMLAIHMPTDIAAELPGWTTDGARPCFPHVNLWLFRRTT